MRVLCKKCSTFIDLYLQELGEESLRYFMFGSDEEVQDSECGDYYFLWENFI